MRPNGRISYGCIIVKYSPNQVFKSKKYPIDKINNKFHASLFRPMFLNQLDLPLIVYKSALEQQFDNFFLSKHALSLTYISLAVMKFNCYFVSV